MNIELTQKSWIHRRREERIQRRREEIYLKEQRDTLRDGSRNGRSAIHADRYCVFIIIFTIGNRQDGHPRYAHMNEDLSSRDRQIISFFPFSTEIQGIFHTMPFSS